MLPLAQARVAHEILAGTVSHGPGKIVLELQPQLRPLRYDRSLEMGADLRRGRKYRRTATARSCPAQESHQPFPGAKTYFGLSGEFGLSRHPPYGRDFRRLMAAPRPGAGPGASAIGFRPGPACRPPGGWGEPLFTLMRAQISRCFGHESHDLGVHPVEGTTCARSCAISHRMSANRWRGMATSAIWKEM